MRGDTYSTYEAKAHLSEILRKVQQRRRIVITSRGRPIAQVVPFSQQADESFQERLKRFEVEGILEGAILGSAELRAVARKDGALTRFLADRE